MFFFSSTAVVVAATIVAVFRSALPLFYDYRPFFFVLTVRLGNGTETI